MTTHTATTPEALADGFIQQARSLEDHADRIAFTPGADKQIANLRGQAKGLRSAAAQLTDMLHTV